jgi:hypothetical protein
LSLVERKHAAAAHDDEEAMILMPRASRGTNRSIRTLLLSLLLLSIVLLASWRVHRLVASHAFDLAYARIFRTQFRVYILTHSCGRLTPAVAAGFDSVVLVPDVRDSPRCAALNHTQLHLDDVRRDGGGARRDDAFRAKYVGVLRHCRRGERMKCLILEDDVVLLHGRRRTREVLVENTLSLFNLESDAFDCAKRGFGWLRSTHTGNGSQCRVFSKPSTECMIACLGDEYREHLDLGLATCQAKCNLTQKRFLLAVHSGLSSTMERESKSESKSE